MQPECGIETRNDGTPICSLHKQRLEDISRFDKVENGVFLDAKKTFICPVTRTQVTIPWVWPTRRANSYATVRHSVDETRFIEIEFYMDGERHHVWPYIGRQPHVTCHKGHEFVTSGQRHFVVAGAFDSHEQAHEAALRAAEQYLAIPDWDQRLD